MAEECNIGFPAMPIGTQNAIHERGTEYLEVCRVKRNTFEYDLAGVTTRPIFRTSFESVNAVHASRTNAILSAFLRHLCQSLSSGQNLTAREQRMHTICGRGIKPIRSPMRCTQFPVVTDDSVSVCFVVLEHLRPDIHQVLRKRGLLGYKYTTRQ